MRCKNTRTTWTWIKKIAPKTKKAPFRSLRELFTIYESDPSIDTVIDVKVWDIRVSAYDVIVLIEIYVSDGTVFEHDILGRVLVVVYSERKKLNNILIDAEYAVKRVFGVF